MKGKTSMPKSEETKTNTETSAALEPIRKNDAVIRALETATPGFLQRYGDRVGTILTNLEALDGTAILSELPDDIREQADELLAGLTQTKQGMWGEEDSHAAITEIKLNYGVGNDPNRPPKMAVGELYSSASEVIGEVFRGYIIGAVPGRILWKDDSSGDGESESGIMCSSKDRVVGSTFGTCATCPNVIRWDHGVKSGNCGENWTLYWVDEALTDIFTVYLHKKSAAAGSRLQRLVKMDKRTKTLWGRKYELGVTETANKAGNRKWNIFSINKTTEMTDPALEKFLGIISRTVEATTIIPSLVNIYRAADEMEKELSNEPEAAVEADTNSAAAAYADMD
jgi:hypothetical protein